MAGAVSSWAAGALLRFARLQVAETSGERFLRLAAESRARITEFEPYKAAQAIKRGAALVDVREKEEFHRGHIQRALNLPRGTLELEIEKRFPNPELEMVLYCGAGNRSALAADNLQRMGYTNIRVIEGGFQGWINAGLPAWQNRGLIED